MEKTKISNINLANNFNEDVTKWRQLAAKIWSLSVIFFMIHFNSLIDMYGLFNFTGLLAGFFIQFFSLNYWFYSLIILAIYWMLFSFNDKLYRISPRVYSSNLEKLGHIANSLHSVCLIVKLISALIISTLLLKSCSNGNYNYFYIVCFCGFSSFLTELKFSFDENYLLNWPIIEQTKYFRFKSQVYNLILKSIKTVFCHFLLWQTMYILGSFSVNLFSTFNNESESISSTTLFAAIKLGFILNFSNFISWQIYETYLTEIFHFNIQSNIHSQLNLSTAMTLNNHSYIQTLAFIDFSDLSIYSAQRRNQLFSLSLTSNQPLNWIKVSSGCLNLIKGFMEAFSFDEMVHGNAVNDSKTKQTADTPNRFGALKISTLSPLRDSNALINETTRLRSPQSLNYTKKETLIRSNTSFKVLDFIKQQKLLSNIYNENPNSKIQSLFIDSFLVIHALKGLSNLVMKSFTEDQYGIVQQTLPDILTTLIQLQKLLEKFNSSNAGASLSFKVLQNENANDIDLMVQKLVFVLNQSIFKITQTFGTSLRSLPLSEEVMKRLKRFYLTQ